MIFLMIFREANACPTCGCTICLLGKHDDEIAEDLNQKWYLIKNIKMYYETENDDFLLNFIENRWLYCFVRFEKIKG